MFYFSSLFIEDYNFPHPIAAERKLYMLEVLPKKFLMQNTAS